MIKENDLSLVNTVEDTDKIRVVTVDGLSHSIEVGHLRNSLFINELSNEVSALEIRANANDTAHDTIDSRLTSLESAVGEEGDGETELGFGLAKKVNDIASDLAKIDPEDITRLGNNISQIQADLTSINGTNGQLAILTDRQADLESAVNAGLKVISEIPDSASAIGQPGEVCWDSSYFYVCVETNTWNRIPLSSW